MLLSSTVAGDHIFKCGSENGVCVIGTYPDLQSDVHFYNCTGPDGEGGCKKVYQRCPRGYSYRTDLRQCSALANGKHLTKNIYKTNNQIKIR